MNSFCHQKHVSLYTVKFDEIQTDLEMLMNLDSRYLYTIDLIDQRYLYARVIFHCNQAFLHIAMLLENTHRYHMLIVFKTPPAVLVKAPLTYCAIIIIYIFALAIIIMAQ